MLYLDELDQEMSRRGLRYVRFADDVTVFTKSRKAARRCMKKLTKYIENTMEYPVNRDKTTIEKVGKLTLFGVTRDHDTWRIQRDKARGTCAIYLGLLDKYKRTKDDYWLWTAARSMRGFISHFGIFPDFNYRQIRAIKRWCLNKWWGTGERKTLFEQKWLITDQKRQSQPARAN